MVAAEPSSFLWPVALRSWRGERRSGHGLPAAVRLVGGVRWRQFLRRPWRCSGRSSFGLARQGQRERWWAAAMVVGSGSRWCSRWVEAGSVHGRIRLLVVTIRLLAAGDDWGGLSWGRDEIPAKVIDGDA